MSETADGITWVDREYAIPAMFPAPGRFTGAQQLARYYLTAIKAWGPHEVTDARYVEETAQSAEGLYLWGRGPRAIRTECTVDGRRVVIRQDAQVAINSVTITVDGEPVDMPSLTGYRQDERINIIALTIYRALN
ncbi:hypothetical protein [Streptomyces alboflavus]|uniref:hypothetical protein n=1 Tax=Streptomyces alboflavus TaxID=67267 RepID=UPI000F658DD6|nr:hypothetical protein [Streptomyces alboflavus]